MNWFKNWMKKKIEIPMKFTDRTKVFSTPHNINRTISSTYRSEHTHDITASVCVFLNKIVNLMVNNDVLVFSTIDNKCSWTINNINGRNKTSSHTIKYDRLVARDRPNVNVNCHWISKHLQFSSKLQSANGFQFYDHSLATNKMALIILFTVICIRIIYMYMVYISGIEA